MDFIAVISQELNVAPTYVKNVLDMLEEKSTIPFIARYRKEATGSMDEVEITAIRDKFKWLMEIEDRRNTILKSINEQGKLTAELKEKIEKANTLPELEDIYLPYKPKRKTKASMAKEKGLQPLADEIYKQKNIDVNALAAKFINEEKVSFL